MIEPNKPLPAAALRDDLRIVRGALEESHVGLYWFTSRSDLDRRLRAVADAASRPMTARAFYGQLLPVIASLRHGHTTLEMSAPGGGYHLRRLSPTGGFFPAAVRVLDGRLYVTADLSERGTLGPGSEIVALGGRPAGEIVREMRRRLSADGTNETFKDFQIGTRYRFHDLLDLLYGPADSYVIDLLSLGGAFRTRRTVAAEPPARLTERYRSRTGRDIDFFPPAYDLRPLGGGVTLLTLRSFYEGLIPRGQLGFPEFFADAFRRIKADGTRDLILDLRGNEGGNGDLPMVLYSYLADRSLRLPPGRTVLASASLSYLRYAQGVSDDVKAFAVKPGDFVTRAPDGTWTLKPAYDSGRDRTYEPRPDAFTGPLYVLTDGGCFSATNAFLEIVHRFHRRAGRYVRFVGEQNGGDFSPYTSGGQSLSIVLPNSGLKLDIPLLGAVPTTGPASPRVRLPDDRVIPSGRDLVSGTDRELAFVQELIRRRRMAAG